MSDQDQMRDLEKRTRDAIDAECNEFFALAREREEVQRLMRELEAMP